MDQPQDHQTSTQYIETNNLTDNLTDNLTNLTEKLTTMEQLISPVLLNIPQLSILVEYYEIVRNFTVSFLQSFFLDPSNKFIVNLFILLGTLLLFLFRLMTSTTLHYLFLVNNMINSAACMVNNNNQESSKILVMWTTYGAVMMTTLFIDIITKWLEYSLISFGCEVFKCGICYQLVTHPEYVTSITDSCVQIYNSNKIGLTYCQTLGLQAANIIVSSINSITSKENKEKVLILLKKVKIQ